MRRFIGHSWKDHPKKKDKLIVTQEWEFNYPTGPEREKYDAEVPKWLYHGDKRERRLRAKINPSFTYSHSMARAWGDVVHVMNTKKALENGATLTFGDENNLVYRFNGVPGKSYKAVNLSGIGPEKQRKLIEAAKKRILMSK